MISYQTAYLKANYPVEFMAGLLSNEINNTDKISIFVGECKRMGIPILPPDVNRSGLKFTPETARRGSDGTAIRLWPGCDQERGAGRDGGGDSGAGERADAFASLEDFCARLDSRIANRKMLESLVKCGAFDFLGRERAELVDCIEDSLAAAAASHRDRASGQVSLFDDMPVPAPKTGRHAVTPWSPHETMTYEKELLGFYVTGHPLDVYARGIEAGKYQTIVSLGELPDRATFRIAGALTQVDKKFTKKEGKPFAVVWLEDVTGQLEVVLWNEVYVKVTEALVPGRVIAIKGTVDKRDDSIRATAQRVKVLLPDSEAPAVESGGTNGVEARGDFSAMVLRFSPGATAEDLAEVRQILATSPGFTAVRLMFERPDGEVLRLDAGSDLRVGATDGVAGAAGALVVARGVAAVCSLGNRRDPSAVLRRLGMTIVLRRLRL